MKSALRSVVCLSLLFVSSNSAVHAQTPPQPDIYEHFLGDWVGTSVYFNNGAKQQTDIRITITETKGKDRVRLDKIYGKKGDPGFTSDTTYLKLRPDRSKFALGGGGSFSEKSWYDAKGLADFAQSGFGEIIGSRKISPNDEPVSNPFNKEFPFSRLTISLTKDTFSYKWEQGADEDHMKIRSIYTLTRAPTS